MRRRLTLSCLAVFLAVSFAHAQVPSINPINGVVPAILNVAGGHDYNLPLKHQMYEWSFGEMVLIQSMAPADSSVLVTHGVLQPCTDQIGVSPYTVLFESGDYRIFPNPTSGPFQLNFFVRTPGQMSLQLINDIGQVISQRSFRYDGCCRRIELFDITHLPNGLYFVVAELVPDRIRPEDRQVIRHSGLKVIKIGN